MRGHPCTQGAVFGNWDEACLSPTPISRCLLPVSSSKLQDACVLQSVVLRRLGVLCDEGIVILCKNVMALWCKCEVCSYPCTLHVLGGGLQTKCAVGLLSGAVCKKPLNCFFFFFLLSCVVQMYPYFFFLIPKTMSLQTGRNPCAFGNKQQRRRLN